MAPKKKRGITGDKTICLPIQEGINYSELVENRDAYRTYLNAEIEQHPELFAEGIEQGYRFHRLVKSSRQGIKTRRIYVPSQKAAYQIRPDFVKSSMSERTEIASKALYLGKHGLSYDGIAYVLGNTEKHWYQLCQSLGRVSIVRATLKRATGCPPSQCRREAYPIQRSQSLPSGARRQWLYFRESVVQKGRT
jgi:hypothetical protein